MAKFIEETNMDKIARALIIDHDKLWVLVCGELKDSTRYCVLEKIRSFGIEPESQLYRDIDYSICTKESIKDRPIHWNHDILICNIDGLITEVFNVVCTKICINKIGL